MKTWNSPTMMVLDIANTENGALPATYESDYAGHMTLDGVYYCVVSGYLWESGMSMNGYTSVQKPYYYDGNGNTVYYEG